MSKVCICENFCCCCIVIVLDLGFRVDVCWLFELKVSKKHGVLELGGDVVDCGVVSECAGCWVV